MDFGDRGVIVRGRCAAVTMTRGGGAGGEVMGLESSRLRVLEGSNWSNGMSELEEDLVENEGGLRDWRNGAVLTGGAGAVFVMMSTGVSCTEKGCGVIGRLGLCEGGSDTSSIINLSVSKALWPKDGGSSGAIVNGGSGKGAGLLRGGRNEDLLG